MRGIGFRASTSTGSSSALPIPSQSSMKEQQMPGEDYMSSSFISAAEAEAVARARARALAGSEARPGSAGASGPTAAAASSSMWQRLESGLGSAIPESNRGHRLLSRMGFSTGQGLGKHGSGVSEPVTLQISSTATRGGIGRSRHLKETEERQIRLIQRRKQILQENFRGGQSNKFQSRQLRQTLDSCMRACRELDEGSKVMTNFMWLKPHDKLYADRELYDPEYDSRGFERPFDEQFHAAQQQLAGAEAVAATAANGSRTTEREELEERLDEIMSYMRTRYHYCFYCGSRYANNDELQQHCPGLFQADHD